jgi:hypothetical protein
MLIFSFDAGIKNLGVCVLQVAQGKQYNVLIERLRDLKAQMLAKTTTLCINNTEQTAMQTTNHEQINNMYVMLCELKLILHEIQELLSLFIQIKFINTVDLLNAASHVKDVPHYVRVERLAYFMHCLDAQYGKPDVVLIEKQFTISEHVNAVSKYINNHYCCVRESDFKLNIAEFPLSRLPLPAPHETKIYIVNPILKNTFDIDKTRPYSYFIAQYNNKTSNKKHTDTHLKYWCKVWGIKFTALNKTDDSADAFMMAYAMVKSKFC